MPIDLAWYLVGPAHAFQFDLCRCIKEIRMVQDSDDLPSLKKKLSDLVECIPDPRALQEWTERVGCEMIIGARGQGGGDGAGAAAAASSDGSGDDDDNHDDDNDDDDDDGDDDDEDDDRPPSKRHKSNQRGPVVGTTLAGGGATGGGMRRVI
jgi:hypothetical protein